MKSGNSFDDRLGERERIPIGQYLSYVTMLKRQAGQTMWAVLFSKTATYFWLKWQLLQNVWRR